MRAAVLLSASIPLLGASVFAADDPAPHAPALAPPPAASPAVPTETLTERELRLIIARERAIWTRLEAKPDDEMEQRRAETDFRDVLTAYENLLRTAPEFAGAYAAYGLLLSRTGNRPEAVKAFIRANQLDPNLAVVKNQLGNFVVEEGNYREGLAYYLSAVELAPDEPLYHYQLGTVLHEFRRFFIADGMFDAATLDAKSQEAFRRAAALAPDKWAYGYRYAESFYDREEAAWDAALVVWRQLETKARPGLEVQTVRLHIARVLIEAGRLEEARPIVATIDEPALATNRQKLVDYLSRAPHKPD